MDLLTGVFDETIEIDGVEYEINSDFRTGIFIMRVFESFQFASFEKVAMATELLFKQLPEDFNKAYAACVRFLDGGIEVTNDQGKPNPRLFSFTNDSATIYAAFRETYGIDLQTAQMHWWQFLGLFQALNKETYFSQLMGLRYRVKTGSATKEEFSLIDEHPELLPSDPLTYEELEENEQLRKAEEEFMRLNEIGQQRIANGSV